MVYYTVKRDTSPNKRRKVCSIGFLANLHQNNPQEFVALYADEEVPYGKIVEILDKGSRNGLKIVLATKPASAKYAAPEPDEQSATQQQAVTAQPAQ